MPGSNPEATLDSGRREGMVVVLDLDDTIIPDREAFRSAAAAVLGAHVRSPRPSDVDELLVRARHRWRLSSLRGQPQALGVSSWEALWSDVDHPDPASAPLATGHAIAVWQDVLAALGGDPRRARSAAQMLIRHREGLVRPYPGAREALVRLGRDHRLWLVTHGSSALQRRKLRLAGLEEYFDLVLVSGEVGLLKDDVAFAGLIEHELRRSALSLQAVVGDSAGDLRLAAHGGWPAVHICPEQPCDRREPAVQHHRTLADVPVALG